MSYTNIALLAAVAGLLVLLLLIGLAAARKRAAGKQPLAAPKPAPKQPAELAPEPKIIAGKSTAERLEVEHPVEKPIEAKRPAVRDTSALRTGLAKTRGGFIARIRGLFEGKKRLDDSLVGELEEVLFTADIGVKTSQRLFERVKTDLSKAELSDPDAVWDVIKRESVALLETGQPPEIDDGRAKPFVLLTIGVNGVGKTTTIGKLAAKLTAAGQEGAPRPRATPSAPRPSSSSRSGASAPTRRWSRARRARDPSSVIFDAIKQGPGRRLRRGDRRHRRPPAHQDQPHGGAAEGPPRDQRRPCEGAPHETLLVLDATNGQNAIQQAHACSRRRSQVTGIVLTKLDGTAKGGVVLGICDELKLPVRYIGIGERVDDLREFDAAEFVEALYAREDAAA